MFFNLLRGRVAFKFPGAFQTHIGDRIKITISNKNKSFDLLDTTEPLLFDSLVLLAPNGEEQTIMRLRELKKKLETIPEDAEVSFRDYFNKDHISLIFRFADNLYAIDIEPYKGLPK